MRAMHYDDFIRKYRLKGGGGAPSVVTETEIYKDLIEWIPELKSNRDLVFPFEPTENDLNKVLAGLRDHLQTCYRFLTRDPHLRDGKLGVRLQKKSNVIGIGRRFWKDSDA